MKLKIIVRQISIILSSIFISCTYLPSDKKNTISGSEVIGRLQTEARAIDNTYSSTNLKNNLAFRSAHNYMAFSDRIIPIVIKIDREINYEKESVSECIKNMRSPFIGLPLGGAASILTCNIREAGLIELGGISTGGKSARKNELLLNLLALP